ncbi:MAG: hypothetical protein KatS3mg111_3616 [Pirellulaceae bacterium]|nr:MAG: hypothetical protein KatS3mg111_3616 [Pirellulaceae bacterium]
MKSLVNGIDQGVSPQAENHLADEGSWGVLKAGCVNEGVFREREHKRLPPGFDFDPKLAVGVGDVLVSRASGSPRLVGSVARVRRLSYRLILSDKTFRLSIGASAIPDFIVYSVNCRGYRNQVEEAISGAEGLANNLPLSALRAFVFLLPPLPEQTAIVEYLDAQTGKIDHAADAARREIELLKEFRTRLIADVVTGKVDVREVAVRLPEEPPEEEPPEEEPPEEEPPEEEPPEEEPPGADLEDVAENDNGEDGGFSSDEEDADG